MKLKGQLKYRNETVIVGVVLVILVFTGLNIADYRQILLDNPDQDLFLLDYVNSSGGRLELLARSPMDDIDFFRYKFEKDRVTIYHERDKVATSYWQVFMGSQGVFFNEKQRLIYRFDELNSRAIVVFNITYYKSSRKTVPAVNLVRVIEIFPNLLKETVTVTPLSPSKYSTGYNMKYIVVTDISYSKSFDIDDSGEWVLVNDKGVSLDVTRVKELVSQARLQMNGKLITRFKSSPGVQVLTPSVASLRVGLRDEVSLIKNGGLFYRKRELVSFKSVYEVIDEDASVCSWYIDNSSLLNITSCVTVKVPKRILMTDLKGAPLYVEEPVYKLVMQGRVFDFSTGKGCYPCGSTALCLSRRDGYNADRDEDFWCALRSGESGWLMNLSTGEMIESRSDVGVVR